MEILDKNDIIVAGCDDILVNLASCCTPVFGDEIIGYITKGQGITVHKKSCVNMREIKDRLIDVEWNNKNDTEDKKYNSKKNPIRRMCLHATYLEFTHPVTNKRIVINDNYPEIFDKLLG